jgi:hypothetical protein
MQKNEPINIVRKKIDHGSERPVLTNEHFLSPQSALSDSLSDFSFVLIHLS